MVTPVQSKAQIVDLLQQNKTQITVLGVRRIGLFGSFARGEPIPDSDVDLLVEFEPNRKTFDNFMRLSFLLEELFQRPVELVTPEALSVHIGPRIMEQVEYVPLVA